MNKTAELVIKKCEKIISINEEIRTNILKSTKKDVDPNLISYETLKLKIESDLLIIDTILKQFKELKSKINNKNALYYNIMIGWDWYLELNEYTINRILYNFGSTIYPAPDNDESLESLLKELRYVVAKFFNHIFLIFQTKEISSNSFIEGVDINRQLLSSILKLISDKKINGMTQIIIKDYISKLNQDIHTYIRCPMPIYHSEENTLENIKLASYLLIINLDLNYNFDYKTLDNIKIPYVFDFQILNPSCEINKLI